MRDPNYDFSRFIDRIKDLPWHEMIVEAESVSRNVEAGLSQVKGAVERRKRGGGEFVQELGQLLFFLRFGAKPDGVSDENWGLIQVVAERLVEKGQFKSGILDIF